MAIKYYETYPQRWDSPSQDYPQGAFKNLSALGEQDGSYLEASWLNDQSGFFGALLRNAEMTPNGLVDTAQKSQFYDALVAVAEKVVGEEGYRKLDNNEFEGFMQVRATDDTIGAGVILMDSSGKPRGQMTSNSAGLQFAYHGDGTSKTYTLPEEEGELLAGAGVLNSWGEAVDKPLSQSFLTREVFRKSEVSPLVSDILTDAKLSDNYFSSCVQDLTIAHNKQGITLGASRLIKHDHKQTPVDTASRIVDALLNLPPAVVFCGFERFGSEYVNMRVRDIESRYHVGKAIMTYAIKDYNGVNAYRSNITGDWLSALKTTYYFDKPTELSKQMTETGARYIRVATNAMPDASRFDTLPSVISNGVLHKRGDTGAYYWSTCFIKADGKMEVVPHKGQVASDVVEDKYYKEGAIQSLSFRVPLVVKGVKYDAVGGGYTTQAGYSDKLSGRTAIGQREDGSLLLIVIDGKTDVSGVSLSTLADIMLSENCVEAFNLDGGGSSEMMIAGEIVNTPSDGTERKLINALYLI